MNEVSIEFEIEDPMLISVNDQYMHPVRKTKSGKYYSYFAPTPYLKKLKSYYEEMLSQKISDSDIEDIKNVINSYEGKKEGGIDLSIELGLPLEDVRNHDISNFIKALEDCIVKRTGIDDSRNYKVSIEEKLYANSEGTWMLRVTYKPCKIKIYVKDEYLI